MIDWIVSGLSISSIYFLTDKKKIGIYFGLLAQPFWFIIVYSNGYYPIIIVSIIHTLIYLKRLKTWDKNDR